MGFVIFRSAVEGGRGASAANVTCTVVVGVTSVVTNFTIPVVHATVSDGVGTTFVVR